MSTKDLRLPVGDFKDHRAHLAMYVFAEQHDLTRAAVADLLNMSTTVATYRTPYLLEKFIKARKNLKTQKVHCCRNRCLAYKHKRALRTECDAYGAPRHRSGRRPSQQITFFSLTPMLAHLLGDPIIEKSMLETMVAARQAADEGRMTSMTTSMKINGAFSAGECQLDGFFVRRNVGRDGFQLGMQNGFESWPIVAT